MALASIFEGRWPSDVGARTAYLTTAGRCVKPASVSAGFQHRVHFVNAVGYRHLAVVVMQL